MTASWWMSHVTCAAVNPTPNAAGGSISADAEANEQLYGQGAEPGAILGGRVRPPQTFQPLYEELAAVLAGDPIEPQGLDTPDDARVSLVVISSISCQVYFAVFVLMVS